MNMVILSSCLVMMAGLWSVMVTTFCFRNQPQQLPSFARKTQWLSMAILLLQFQGILHFFSDLPFNHLYAGMAWVCVWLVLQIACQLIQPGWQSSGLWIWFLGGGLLAVCLHQNPQTTLFPGLGLLLVITGLTGVLRGRQFRIELGCSLSKDFFLATGLLGFVFLLHGLIPYTLKETWVPLLAGYAWVATLNCHFYSEEGALPVRPPGYLGSVKAVAAVISLFVLAAFLGGWDSGFLHLNLSALTLLALALTLSLAGIFAKTLLTSMESMVTDWSLPSVKKFEIQVQESIEVLPRLMSQDDFLSHLTEMFQSLLGSCRFVLYVSEDKTLRNFQTMAYGWSPSPLTHPSREALSAWLKEDHQTCLFPKLSEEMKIMLAELFNETKGTESLVTWLDNDRECMLCLCLQTEEPPPSWRLGRLRTTLCDLPKWVSDVFTYRKLQDKALEAITEDPEKYYLEALKKESMLFRFLSEQNKDRQKEIIEHEKRTALTRFSIGLDDDISNPLNNMVMAIQFEMERYGKENAFNKNAQYRLLDIIISQSLRIKEILEKRRSRMELMRKGQSEL